MQNYKKGFTLIEVLLVVAIIAILAGIVILAINPARQLAKTKNAERSVDVNTILNAVYQYTIDNNGVMPSSITNNFTEICKTNASCSGYVDLSVLTLNEQYLTALPADPVASTTNGTGYFIYRTTNNRVTVTAPSAEISASISVTR